MKYAPGVLWTAAHHRIPLLSVMLNNRGYHQEIMHVQRMCNERNRGVDRGTTGSTLTDPNIAFTKVAQGMGLHGEGPITDPRDLGPAIVARLQQLNAANRRSSMAVTFLDVHFAVNDYLRPDVIDFSNRIDTIGLRHEPVADRIGRDGWRHSSATATAIRID